MEKIDSGWAELAEEVFAARQTPLESNEKRQVPIFCYSGKLYDPS